MGIFRGVGGTGESSSDSTITAATALAAAAAASASAASTSATSAGTSATNAATSASDAATSATSATASASAASTSATNAATSASSASTSASTATTQASAASASASAAATSETNAATSETNAATSETNAATSETNAATSATNAATSATNAAASATTAASYTPSQTGNSGKFLTTNGTVTSWETINTGTVTSVAALTLGTTGTDLSSTVANGTTTPVITLNIPTASATNRGALSSADWTTFNNKGTGTVASVTGTSPVASSGGTTPAISLAASYGDTQNPYASKTANYVLAAPDGSAGVPTFRAIVAADIPTLNQNTTGSAGSLSSTLAIASGGSGQTTAQLAMNAFAGAVTSGSYLRGNGTNVVMDTIQAADVPTLNQNTSGSAASLSATLVATSGGTDQSSYAVGDLLYASTTTALSKLADVATGNALISGGVGVAPSYGKIGLTTHVSGTLAVGNGGTGATTLAGASIATYTGSATLTNKRIQPRVTSATSASSLTPSVATADIYAYTALATGLTINAPTGTPVNGEKLMFRLLDNGTSQTLTWNATYTVIGVTLPTATTISKTTYVGCIYNAANTRWDVLAVTTEA